MRACELFFLYFSSWKGRDAWWWARARSAWRRSKACCAAERRFAWSLPTRSTRVQELSAQGQIELAGPRLRSLRTSLVAISSSRPPTIAKSIGLSSKKPHADSILCNTADDPPLCDFFFGSIVQRGDLQIAISTAGESPALAQRLRREIDAQLPPDLGPWLEELGQLRREVLQAMPAGRRTQGTAA